MKMKMMKLTHVSRWEELSYRGKKRLKNSLRILASIQTDFVDVTYELRKQVQDLKQVVAELTALNSALFSFSPQGTTKFQEGDKKYKNIKI